jgi:hypothetical protein
MELVMVAGHLKPSEAWGEMIGMILKPAGGIPI